MASRNPQQIDPATAATPKEKTMTPTTDPTPATPQVESQRPPVPAVLAPAVLPPAEGFIRVRAIVPHREHFRGLYCAGEFWPTGTYLVDVSPAALNRIAEELRHAPGVPSSWLQLERLDTGEQLAVPPVQLPEQQRAVVDQDAILARARAIKERREAEQKAKRSRAEIEAAEEASRQAVQRDNEAARERFQMELEEAKQLVAEDDARIAEERAAQDRAAGERGIQVLR